MAWVFGILLGLGGAVIFAVAAQMVVAANPESRVPQWFGRPERNPGRAYLARGLAALALFGGTLLLTGEIGPWVLVLLPVVLAPTVAVVSRHNRGAAATLGRLNA